MYVIICKARLAASYSEASIGLCSARCNNIWSNTLWTIECTRVL